MIPHTGDVVPGQPGHIAGISQVFAVNVSTLAMYLQLLDRVEELLPCRQERRLKAVLNETKIHLLTLEPDDLRAVWQEFC